MQPVNLDTLFHLGGNLVLPGWLLLMLAPTWVWTRRYTTFAVPLLLAVTYGWLLLHAHPPGGAGFGSLAAVRLLFSAPEALLAGWLHYLAFDLFTGAWEARDAARLRISRWVVAPCLVLTFLLGPLGLAAYLLVRVAMRKEIAA